MVVVSKTLTTRPRLCINCNTNTSSACLAEIRGLQNPLGLFLIKRRSHQLPTKRKQNNVGLHGSTIAFFPGIQFAISAEGALEVGRRILEQLWGAQSCATVRVDEDRRGSVGAELSCLQGENTGMRIDREIVQTGSHSELEEVWHIADRTQGPARCRHSDS